MMMMVVVVVVVVVVMIMMMISGHPAEADDQAGRHVHLGTAQHPSYRQ